ncbi:polymer-forming cytoskeletal protein [Patescibacteria group bacterium]|nr:MAG: polymer-forming cytoskeletal protein [Patescibacteria group bacterium]
MTSKNIMIFQRTPKYQEAEESFQNEEAAAGADNVETVVGPSVNVEGDFSSEGNIVVKGTVAGSVHTSKHLSVEEGAKIMANVKAGSARVAGEVKGNMKIKETLELTASARVLGDIEVKTIQIESGALLYGRIIMPGLEGMEPKTSRQKYTTRKNDSLPAESLLN